MLQKKVTFCFFLQETSPSRENEPEMLGARRTFKVKRKRMKNKFKFKKASLNATDLMKGEDGERHPWITDLNLFFYVYKIFNNAHSDWLKFSHLYRSIYFFCVCVNKSLYDAQSDWMKFS